MTPSRSPRGLSWEFLAPSLAIAISLSIAYSRVSLAEDEVPTQPQKAPGTQYVEAAEQLVVELFVRNVKKSAAFYEQLGFKVIRKEPTFVELGWDDSRLFLQQIPAQPKPPATLVANIRIMVPDVDLYWKLCRKMKLPVRHAVGDRNYGLRDFIVVSPDGIGLRFASKLAKKAAP